MSSTQLQSLGGFSRKDDSIKRTGDKKKKKEKKAEAMVDLRGRCEREGRGKQNPMNCIKRTNIQHFKGKKKKTSMW